MSVTQVLHGVIVGQRGLAKLVSERLGKPYSTLLRELNPWDRGAKVGVDDLVGIMQATQDVTALQYMAEVMGYRLEPKHRQ